MRTLALSLPWSRIVLPPVCFFGLAFVIDVATDRQFSAVWGSTAIVASIVAVFRSARALVGAIALWLGIWVGFNLLRAIADDAGVRLLSIEAIAESERSIAGTAPSRLLQDAAERAGLSTVADWVLLPVYLSFFVTPHVMALVLFLRRRDVFRRYAVAMSATLAIGAIAFVLLPTAPPWMVDASIRRVPHEVFAGGTGSRALGFDPNGLAAFPSVHMAAVTLTGLAMAASGATWRSIGFVYAMAMGLAIVYLGEHHVVDAIGGGALAVVCWRAAMLVGRDARRPTE